MHMGCTEREGGHVEATSKFLRFIIRIKMFV